MNTPSRRWLWPVVLLALLPLIWSASLAMLGFGGLVMAGALYLWQRRRTPYDAALIGVLGWLPITALAVGDWGEGLPKLNGLLYGLLLFAVLASQWMRPPVVAVAFLAAGGLLAAVAFVATDWLSQKLLPIDRLVALLPALVRGVSRGTASGGLHPNQVGGLLALLLPPALAGAWIARWRFAVLGVVALMALALVFTQSRSAYLGIAAAAVVAVANRSRALAVPAALTAVAGAALLVTRWTSGTGVDTFAGRIELWSRATAMIADLPLTGAGLGQFSLVLHALYAPSFLEPFVPHAHNLYLQTAIDLGIPGAIGVLAIVALVLWRLLRTRSILAIGIAAGLIAFLVYGLTDTIATGARGGLILWLTLGLGASLTSPAGRVEDNSQPL